MSSTSNVLKKNTQKLIIAFISLTVALTMLVTVSYAWISMSTSPVVSGAQIAIAGGNTILLAPDITETVVIDGKEVTVHYPGKFSNNVNFAKDGSYEYLSMLAGLTPVSTADGINWVMASYDEVTGEINPIDEFNVDNTLERANITEAVKDGNYIYLDFWVVSPGADYKLRVSCDVRSGEGSSVIQLPEVVEDDKTLTGLSLADPDNSVSASIRVGFLANGDSASDNAALYYSRSDKYDSRYTKLLGNYQEKGEKADPTAQNRFTIYEPNGTIHTAAGLNDGDYVITNPLKFDMFTEKITETDIRDILTVQKASVWRNYLGNRELDQSFQAAVSGMDGVTKDDALNRFFNDYLQWRASQYINTGKFFSSTNSLYSNVVGGKAEAARLDSNVLTAGATNDVIITSLERNTPQRIRMFVWLEGQDVDCLASNVGANEFLLNIELAGASE